MKIPFISKGIDFIDLPSIVRDNKVESYVPTTLKTKYNKSIRNAIFNFNTLSLILILKQILRIHEVEPPINSVDITLTCPCNVYPLTPHFNIAKLGCTGVYVLLLLL